jgi:hypothetical protein
MDIVNGPDLASHSPFIREDRDDGSVHFFLDGSVDHTDMEKMAQAMPPLMKAARPLMAEEENEIGYTKMDAGQKRYVCGHDDGGLEVLSHVFVDEAMVIAAGAKDAMVEMQAILLKKGAVVDGNETLEFKERMKQYRSKDNIGNCGRAITLGPTIATGQRKIAPVKHIQLACKHDISFREQITKLNTFFAYASQRIFHQHLNQNYIDLNQRRFSVDCVLGFGHEDNVFTSTAQINYSAPQGGDLEKDLLTFGGLHIDHTDDTVCYACLLFLSNLPAGVFPGRFCLPL